MRIFNTNNFVDKNADYINAYYSLLTEGEDQNALRGKLEMKLYHLPSYFGNYSKDGLRKVHLLEYDLTHMNVALNPIMESSRCEKCLRSKPLTTLAGRSYCTECWLNLLHQLYVLWRSAITWVEKPQLKYFSLREDFYQSERVPGYEWFWDIEVRKDLAELNSLNVMKNEFRFMLSSQRKRVFTSEVLGHSPKRTLLAHVLGCNSCGTFLEMENPWATSSIGWKDGLCPECEGSRGRWFNSSYEPIGYDECVMCNSIHAPYAIWGMCVDCYSQWQEQYTCYDILLNTARTYGPLTLLLVSHDIAWLRYLREVLPKQFFKGHTLIPWAPKAPKPKINIRERVCSVLRGT